LVSRSQVNLIRQFKFPHTKRTWSGIPIIASNMDTVGTIDMWKALSKNKCLTCLHKFVDTQDVIDTCKSGDADPNYVMISTGI
jgi:GMP reductase